MNAEAAHQVHTPALSIVGEDLRLQRQSRPEPGKRMAAGRASSSSGIGGVRGRPPLAD